MTARKPDPTSLELFLAPLARHARKHPDVEGLVFWGGVNGWDPTPSEALEAEEITFYAEGLLLDGFRMQWTVVALPDTPIEVDHIRLEFWQDDSPAPPLPAGWHKLESEVWIGG